MDDKILVENRLHLLDGLEPGLAAFDTETLVEQSTMQTLDNAVGLRTIEACIHKELLIPHYDLRFKSHPLATSPSSN